MPEENTPSPNNTLSPLEEKKDNVPSRIPPTSSGKLGTKLTKEEREKMFRERKKTPFLVALLKYIALLLVVGGIGTYSWLSIELEPENKYLSLFNLGENTSVRYQKSTEERMQKEVENAELVHNLEEINRKLETKEYSLNTEKINNIRANQLVWFDEKNEEDETVYGILNSPSHIQQYLSSEEFEDLVLNGSNEFIIKNIKASRNDLKFRVISSNIFGKVFYLNTEFIRMMNSFSFLKNGDIRNFTRKQNEEEEDVMEFAIKFDIQSPEETDSFDEYFTEYETWKQGL